MERRGESNLLAGIFVGGASSRMGRPKGLLVAPSGEPLVERWRGLFAAAKIPCVLVGRRAEYAAIDCEVVEDVPPGAGPIGGLAGLIGAAGRGRVIAVACDMPFVTGSLLRRLVEHPSGAAALAPRRQERWEPLFARYDVALARGAVEHRARSTSRSLQRLLDELAAEVLPLHGDEEALLCDWDAPHDMRGT